MDEEGQEKRFEYKKYAYQSLSRFRLTDNHNKTHLESLVEPKQLVSAFYKGIKKFSSSAAYIKSEWEDELLWERMTRVTEPPADREVVLRYLLSQTREQIIKVFFMFVPSLIISVPDAKNEKESWARSVDAMLHPDDPEKTKGIVERPQFWNMPEDFDSWQIQERTVFLEESLDENVSNWDGTRLGNIQSEVINKYLGDYTQNSVVSDDGGL